MNIHDLSVENSFFQTEGVCISLRQMTQLYVGGTDGLSRGLHYPEESTVLQGSCNEFLHHWEIVV